MLQALTANTGYWQGRRATAATRTLVRQVGQATRAQGSGSRTGITAQQTNPGEQAGLYVF